MAGRSISRKILAFRSLQIAQMTTRAMDLQALSLSPEPEASEESQDGKEGSGHECQESGCRELNPNLAATRHQRERD